MSMKYAIVILLLVVAAMGVKLALFTEESEQSQKPEAIIDKFPPCLPNIVVSKELLLLSDENKEKEARKILKKAVNTHKNLSGEPSELWSALEDCLLAEELVNQCKNVEGALKIELIDLKSTLIETQRQWIQKLQLEVVRHRRQHKFEASRFCLRKLFRLVPDESHPVHQMWLNN